MRRRACARSASLEVVEVERRVVMELDEPHRQIEVARELEPRRDVPSWSSLVTRISSPARSVAADGAREREVERRHVLSEDDLVGSAAEEARGGEARVRHERVAPDARLEGAPEVRVRFAQVRGDRVDHRVEDMSHAGGAGERRTRAGWSSGPSRPCRYRASPATSRRWRELFAETCRSSVSRCTGSRSRTDVPNVLATWRGNGWRLEPHARRRHGHLVLRTEPWLAGGHPRVSAAGVRRGQACLRPRHLEHEGRAGLLRGSAARATGRGREAQGGPHDRGGRRRDREGAVGGTQGAEYRGYASGSRYLVGHGAWRGLHPRRADRGEDRARAFRLALAADLDARQLHPHGVQRGQARPELDPPDA